MTDSEGAENNNDNKSSCNYGQDIVIFIAE